jgi:hypothetical protein
LEKHLAIEIKEKNYKITQLKVANDQLSEFKIKLDEKKKMLEAENIKVKELQEDRDELA